MIRFVLAAALGTAPAGPAETTAQSGPVRQTRCEIDRSTMLRLSHEDFDEDATKGWRSVSRRAGCRLAAANLVRDYRMENWGKLRPHELHLNYWHEGQLRAFECDTDAAVPLLLAGANPDSIDGFPHYAMATVAFLQRDLVALKAARARLASLPVPQWFNKAKKTASLGSRMRWPANLDVVDRLIACFEKSYSEAYSNPECRTD